MFTLSPFPLPLSGVIFTTCTTSWYRTLRHGNGRKPSLKRRKRWAKRMKMHPNLWLFCSTNLFTRWAPAVQMIFWNLMSRMPLLICIEPSAVVKLLITALVRYNFFHISLISCSWCLSWDRLLHSFANYLEIFYDWHIMINVGCKGKIAPSLQRFKLMNL